MAGQIGHTKGAGSHCHSAGAVGFAAGDVVGGVADDDDIAAAEGRMIRRISINIGKYMTCILFVWRFLLHRLGVVLTLQPHINSAIFYCLLTVIIWYGLVVAHG